MPWMAAAMGVQALATIGGGILGSNAADKAAQTSAAASNAAIGETRREFDVNQGNLRPWLQTGSSALGKIAKLYGLDSYSLPPPTGAGATLTPEQQQARGASDAQTIGQIRNGLVQWGNQFPGAADSIIQLIDSGAPLSNVNAALQSARATTTNPVNTAFLDPIITMGQSGASAPSGTYVPAPSSGGTSASGTAGDMSDFFASPDFAWRLEQGQKALEARASTGVFGGVDSGPLRKAEIKYGGNLASGEFGTYVNRLAGIAGTGQTAATQTAELGANASNSIANRLQNAGDTQASAYGAQGKTWADTLGRLGNIGAGYLQNQGNNAPVSVDTSSLPNNANVVNSNFQLPAYSYSNPGYVSPTRAVPQSAVGFY